MHLVLEILLWLQFWILECCCIVVVFNEHQVLIFCSLAVPCFSARWYLVQQHVILNTGLCLFLLTIVYIWEHVQNCL